MILVAAALTATLAGCLSAKPTTSVGALSYQVQQDHTAGTANERIAADPARAQAIAPSQASAEPSTNDPILRLDMP
jgi:hypothetical protein